MVMLDNMQIKDKFEQETEYLKFKQQVNNLYNSLQEEYLFLGFSQNIWTKLFTTCLKNLIVQDTKALTYYANLKKKIKEKLDDLIKKYSDAKNIQLLNNMLLVIIKKRGKMSDVEVIKEFLQNLKKYHIVFDEEYFRDLKLNSQVFKQLLLKIGMVDLSQKDFIECINYYSFYNSLRPFGMRISTTKKLADYYMSILKLYLTEKVDKNNPNFIKLRLLLARYDYIQAIHRLLMEIDNHLEPKQIDVVICNYSVDALKQLFSSYYQYINITYGKNDDFLWVLYHQIAPKDKEKQEKHEERKEPEEQEEQKEPEIAKKSKKIFQKKPFYKRFKSVPGQTEAEKEAIVDQLVNCLPKERQVNIFKYLDREFSCYSENGKQAIFDLSRLQTRYKKYLETGSLVRKTLYEYFKTGPNQTEAEKRQIIDWLMSRLHRLQQINIQRYINKEIVSTSFEGQKALEDIVVLQRAYNRYINTGWVSKNNILTVATDEVIDFLNTDCIGPRRFYNVSAKKIYLLLDALKVVEYTYKVNYGFNNPQYEAFKEQLITQIISNHPRFNLEGVIVLYIQLAYENLMNLKKVVPKL